MKTNSFFLGLVLGFIFPLISHVLTVKTAIPTYFQGKTLSLYVFAAVINLIFIRYCYKRHLDQTGMGAVLATFAALLVLIITKKIIL